MNREARPSPRSTLWRQLCRYMAMLYTLIVRSWIGRAMTAYRFLDHASLDGRYGAGRRIRPAARWHLRFSEAAKDGWIFAILRAPFRALYMCPLKFYGIFGLSFGVLCMLSYVLLPLIFGSLSITGTHWNVAVVMLALSLPLLSSPTTLAEGVCGSRICRRIFVKYLSLPLDYVPRPALRGQAVLSYVAALLAVAATVPTLLVHPLFVPALGLFLVLAGLIFTYPEAGVLLVTLSVPAVWLWDAALPAFFLLLILTWSSFGVKLFLLHRTFRFGFLDRLVLLFGGVVLLSGFVGPGVSGATIARAISLFACISVYFLIVNLTNTRAYVARCFLGLGAGTVLLTAAAYIDLVPADALLWLGGSRAGDALLSIWNTLRGSAEAAQSAGILFFLVLSVPFLYFFILRSKRPIGRVAAIGMFSAILWLMVRTGSLYALLCVAIATLVFILLSGYRAMATSLIALPPLLCVAAWSTVYLRYAWAGLGEAFSFARMLREQAWAGHWRLVLDHPAGIGLSAVADSGTFALELLHSLGWQGLFIGAALLFFAVQKGTTALGHVRAPTDRTLLSAGIAAGVSGLVFSASGGAWLSPAMVLSVTILVALCSVYADLLFDESDILSAEARVTLYGQDRIFRGR